MYSYVYCRGKERWGRKGGERVTGIDERTETERDIVFVGDFDKVVNTTVRQKRSSDQVSIKP